MNNLNLPTDVKWVAEKFHSRGVIESSEFQSILYFALIWNLFEGGVCRRNAKITEFERVIGSLSQSDKLNKEDFSHCLLMSGHIL